MKLKKNSSGQYYRDDDPKKRQSVTDQEAVIISALAFGKRCLDVGTGLGVSANAMIETARSVCSVDPDPWVEDNIRLDPHPYSGRTVCIPSGSWQFALIDGDHSYESCKSDWETVRKQMEPLSVVAFHDNKPGHPGVYKVIQEILEDEDGYAVTTLPTLGRLTLVLV